MNSNWAFYANGVNGGNINLSSTLGGMNFQLNPISGNGQGIIQANGTAGYGGTVSMSLQGNLVTTYIQANGAGSNGRGGNVIEWFIDNQWQ